MKKMLLATLAGFTIAFAAGVISAPPAQAMELQQAQSWIGCRTIADCAGYGQVYCAGDQARCEIIDYGRGQCYCP